MTAQAPNHSLPPQHRVSAAARWRVGLAVGGSLLLIGAYFLPWGHVALADGSPSADIPIQSLFYGQSDYYGQSGFQFVAVFLLFTGPVTAALSALLTLVATRWGRLPLALLNLLASMLSLLVALFLGFARALFIGSVYVKDIGFYLGLGASALIIVAALGLLSTLSDTPILPPADV